MTALAPARIWPGPDTSEAVAAYSRAIKAGFSHLRALVFGGFASFKDCWMLQSTLADFFDCSVRTVQRSAHDAREIGELRCAFGKPGERPPGADAPLHCKWTHRWIPGRGLAAEARQHAINKARAAWVITRAGIRRTFNAPASKPKRMTAEQIDAELERADHEHDDATLAVPPPAPKGRVSAEEIEAMLAGIPPPKR